MKFRSELFTWRYNPFPFFTPHRYLNLTFGLIVILQSLISVSFGQIKMADLKDFTLENGQVIQNCKLAYQTFGRLNAEGSNAILFPTWYGGTSNDLISYIGEGQMLDSNKYFIVVVDAFGNGVSSSPSNSYSQTDIHFPEFSIYDLVEAQHQLLTEQLGIKHLYAVTGISMGAIQTYQWMASYPEFIDFAIPIVGSPELSSYEKLIFEAFERLLTLSESSNKEEVCAISLMWEYALGFSPEYRAANTVVGDFSEFLSGIEGQAAAYSPYDFRSQMHAIRGFNLADKNKGLLSVAQNFRGKALIVYASEDVLLLPESSKRFAALLDAEVLELASGCGHYSFACEKNQISQAVRSFLNQSNQ